MESESSYQETLVSVTPIQKLFRQFENFGEHIKLRNKLQERMLCVTSAKQPVTQLLSRQIVGQFDNETFFCV